MDSWDPGNPFAPFKSKIDWEVARWAKLRGPGSTAVTELFAIPGFAQMLGLSYTTVAELNKIIDADLFGQLDFHHEEIELGGETFDVYFRDGIECIRALYGNPEFAPILVFTPECHYADADQIVQLFHDMNTGKWWWRTQVKLEELREGATIIPIIISSDKTQLMVFGGKTAYPVYMTIGNLPKEIRQKPSHQGQILLAYLPTTRLEHIQSKASRRRAVANLFHECMRKILEPLKQAGVDGLEMASGDGVIRRVHPIFATFVGDYPEQLLVACCRSMRCPRCKVPPDELGDNVLYEDRDLDEILEILASADDPTLFTRNCAALDIRPIPQPFWKDLPFTDIFQSIMPDILHQLYQGVIKHLIAWLKKIYGENEIDARCRRMPPNHCLRFFSKGISPLQRVSGKEHRDICRILIGLIIDLPLPNNLHPARLLRAVCALLDFLHLARYPIHSTETLEQLDKALTHFHENKDIFIDLRIRDNFNFPKLHFLKHYMLAIQLFGTTDNYNTETSERLHIDFTKDAYRATNHRNEYDQMTLWLIRKEKIQRHDKFIKWRLSPELLPLTRAMRLSTPYVLSHEYKVAKWPSARSVDFSTLASAYGATQFSSAISHFLIKHRFPLLSAVRAKRMARSLPLPFKSVATYHKIQFLPLGATRGDAIDAIHARRYNAKAGQSARFDTALIDISTAGSEGESDVHHTRIAQVRVIFTLPKKISSSFFPGSETPVHLAYVEWFSPFLAPDEYHGMYKVTRSCESDLRLSSIVPVSKIIRSVHLFPQFGPVTNRDWTTFDVLENCTAFYYNKYKDDCTFFATFRSP
ncbi:hypothetical protein BOTBODRAFT_121523 [Botryobasidium botryosum FD-172 SS1]|uniref:Uncharacterized protein n=1 Tax=Botryobasidium botryosum (strain FD-172 SS1) TaxID=930990 RepID=A0A067LTP7_BOTB1|nr:hypothetical protein BOTBODRAFT_121523 [Botryobasidium botryosum FD-172 SS1]